MALNIDISYVNGDVGVSGVTIHVVVDGASLRPPQ